MNRSNPLNLLVLTLDSFIVYSKNIIIINISKVPILKKTLFLNNLRPLIIIIITKTTDHCYSIVFGVT